MGETPSQSAAAGKAGIPAGAAAPSKKGAKEPKRSDRAAIPGPSPAVALTGESADSDMAGSPAGISNPQKRGGDVPPGRKRAAIPSSDSNAERAQYCVSTPGNESSDTLSVTRSPVPVCTGLTPAYLWCSVPVCTKSPPNGVPPPNGKRDVRTRCDYGLHSCVGNCDLCCSKRAQYCVSTPGNESSDTLSVTRSPVPVCTGRTPSGERCNLDPFLPCAGQPAVSGIKTESVQ